MAGKLSWEIDLKGGETVAQKIRDLKKEIASSSGISGADLLRGAGGNFSLSFLARNPGLINQLNPPPIIRPAAGNSGKQPTGNLGKLSSLLGGGIFDKIAIAFGELGIIVWGVQKVFQALAPAVRQFLEAIERGSKLYTDSARLGTSQFALASVRNVGNLLNIPPEEMDRLIAQGQFGRHRKTGGATNRGQSQPIGGVMDFFGLFLGGRGSEALSKMQQLTNLQKEALFAWRLTASASLTSALSAKSLFLSGFSLKLVFTDLRALFEGLAASMGPFIFGLGILLHEIIRPALYTLQQLLLLENALGLIPIGKTFTQSLGSGRRIPVSHFESMGFHFGNRGGIVGRDRNNIAIEKTALATEKSASLLTGILTLLHTMNQPGLRSGILNIP